MRIGKQKCLAGAVHRSGGMQLYSCCLDFRGQRRIAGVVTSAAGGGGTLDNLPSLIAAALATMRSMSSSDAVPSATMSASSYVAPAAMALSAVAL